LPTGSFISIRSLFSVPMARLPRLYAPGLPQLVQASFAEPLAQPDQPAPAALLNDLTAWLGAAATRHRVSVHGWVLSIDRVVLLATPVDEEGLPRLMQTLGRNLASRQRGGRIFSGRYRSALLEPGQWVLPALVWLESLPGQSGSPDIEAWPWSSAASHTGLLGSPPSWLVDHADYWSCGNTPFDRQANYRRRLHEGLSREQSERIRATLAGQWALGGPAFLEKLTHTASRRVSPGQRGRPRKQPLPPAEA
jgi:putative transposase